jgi:hypothetical protein
MFSCNLDLVCVKKKREEITFIVPLKSHDIEMVMGKQEKAAVGQFHTQHLRLRVLVPAHELFARCFAASVIVNVAALHEVTATEGA